MHNLTLGDISREHRRTHAKRIATVFDEMRLTYVEFDDRANRLANALIGMGVVPGDRVLWLGRNSSRLQEALIACAKVGAMLCPANWRQTASELSFVLSDLDPRVVLWQDDFLGPLVRSVRESTPSSARWIREDGSDPDGDGYEKVLAESSPVDPDLDVDPASPVLVLYTAAFGGRPNGSMITHTGLLTQSANLLKINDMWPGYVYLNCGPLFHMGTFQFLLATFHIGGTNVFSRQAEALDVARLISDERCEGGMVLPPTIAKIIEMNRDGQYDLSSFRSSISMPGWNEMVNPRTSTARDHSGGYGQTELTGLVVYGAYGGRDGLTSVGRPSPWTRVRIVDDEGLEVADGEVGEVTVRGPLVHAGYWNRSELNADRSRSGWWYTNDLGRRDEDGLICFVGPKSQMIKSGVENIYPAEVETCIEDLAGVEAAAIIGVPDDRFIQSVTAVVCLTGTHEVSADDVVRHCRSRLASYKKPKKVIFAESIPRTRVGAKDYEALDAKYGGGGYPGGSTRNQ